MIKTNDSYARLNVKLNDPLMGTETQHYQSTNPSHLYQTVKLNDPLMGTETLLSLHDTLIIEGLEYS